VPVPVARRLDGGNLRDPISKEEVGFFFYRLGLKTNEGDLESLPRSENEFDFMKEWIFLPLDIQKELQKAIEESTAENAEEFAWEIMVGPCPKCGYQKTMDCEGIEGIDDPTVGLCKRCGFLWCTECGSALGANLDCGHSPGRWVR